MGIRFMITFGACLMSAVAILSFGGEANATEAHYRCSGGGKVTAKFSPPSAAKGEVALTFGTGRELTLPQVMSADGGRYANAGFEFWIKERSATLTMNGVKEPARRDETPARISTASPTPMQRS